jgi:asparagine synthase (glutamine-hydrolysing)
MIEDISATARGICGWVNPATDGAHRRESVAAMTAATRAAPATVALRDGAEVATLAAYGRQPEGWFAATDGIAVALEGRPRWRSSESARLAGELGAAAAALRLYVARGDGFLKDILGAFAVVVVDGRSGSVLLAVDRLGIGRLCYAPAGDGFAFGTSAAAVAAHPHVGRELSRQGIFNYLFCHVVPAPGSVFAKVGKLLPAEMVRFERGRVSRSFYWRLRYEAAAKPDEAEQAEHLRDLLRQAVKRTLASEPTGAFLSGGTDSSTVSGLLGELRGQPAETFSIGFAAEGFDEMTYARTTARHFGARAHEYYVTPDDVAAAMPLIAATYDEPFGNASAVPTYYCARLARESGISVLLAGDGGDEIFGGNARYAKQKLFEWYLRVPAPIRGALEPVLLAVPDAGLPPLRKLQSYVRQARVLLPARLETYNLLQRVPFGETFDAGFLAGVDTGQPIRLMQETWDGTDAPSAVDRMMHLDLKFTLADNDLRKVRGMCEMAGVEVRFPMLDDDLVEFSGTLAPGQKVRGQTLRHFFKASLRSFLPPETISKEKHGFGLPFGHWLAGHRGLQAIVNGAFESLARRGIVRPEYLRTLLDRHTREHATYFGVMIWVLAQLELWLQHHVDGPKG